MLKITQISISYIQKKTEISFYGTKKRNSFKIIPWFLSLSDFYEKIKTVEV